MGSEDRGAVTSSLPGYYHRPTVGVEETVFHTRLQHLALAVEESRAYWSHPASDLSAAEGALVAFEERWFGAKSLSRVRTLLGNLRARYDAFPEALDVLRRWPPPDPGMRRLVCHWHLQLSDPLYRGFTARFLVERRSVPEATIDRDIALRWVSREHPERWGSASCTQFAGKLLSAAGEAGLVSPPAGRRGTRTLLPPRVSDQALAYLLHLLRGVRFAGTLFENPYLESVGLLGDALDQRLRGVAGVQYRRMGSLRELDWAYPDLRAWAEGTR